MKRLPLLNIVILIMLTAIWIYAFNNRVPSHMSDYDLNLAPLGYIHPKIPSNFSSSDPVTFKFKNAGVEVHHEYDNGPDFYRTAYEKGWSKCLNYYLYPSKATWRYSDAHFPGVTESLPTEFSLDHFLWARRDGFKACSNRIESLLASDSELHSKLLIPTWHRFVWPAIISAVFICWMLLRYAYTKWAKR